MIIIKSILADLRKVIKESSFYMGNYDSSMLVKHWKVGCIIAKVVNKYDLTGEDFNDFIKELATKLLCGISYNRKSLLKYYEFYQCFNDFNFLVQHLDNITWDIIRILIKDVDDDEARMFYLDQASIHAWNNVDLYTHIKDNYYESRKNIENVQDKIQNQDIEFVSSPINIAKEKENVTTDNIIVSHSFIKELESIINPEKDYSYDKEANKILTNWKVGERIKKEEIFLSWNKIRLSQITNYVSTHLSNSCKKGFHEQNLKIFTTFYESFQDYEFLKNHLSNIRWKFFHVLMKIKDEKERMFYLEQASENKWDYETLVKRKSKNYYHYYLQLEQDRSKDKKFETKKEYPQFKEADENAMRIAINNLIEIGKISELKEKIILSTEMYLMNSGKGYAFVERQKYISTYYVDLIFYNYKLKCFVIFKFVTNVLKDNDINDLDCFARTFDVSSKNEGDNPSICILVGISSKQDRIYYSHYNPDELNLHTDYMNYLISAEELSYIIKQQKLLYVNFGDETHKI